MRQNWWAVVAALLVAACSDEQKATPKPQAPKAVAPPTPAKPVKPAELVPPPKPAPDPALLARGQYLVEVVTNCAGCHTPMGPMGPDMTKRFAGGMEYKEKFGTWRTPNITQDPDTGIGKWTDEQLATAIREGKRPDGSLMWPIMPYLRYNLMTDEDTKAMVTYLRTIRPIKNTPMPSDNLQIPKMPAPKPANAPIGATPAERGAYLAQLMVCGDCHTPMGPQGPDMTKEYAGGMEFEFPPFLGSGKTYAANITQDKATGIGAWTEEQIAAAITQMKRPDNSMIGPPMAMMAQAWAQLKPEDAQTVAAYFKSLKPISNKVAKSTFKPAAPTPVMATPGTPPGTVPGGSGGAPIKAAPAKP